jgi:hypothetical protein
LPTALGETSLDATQPEHRLNTPILALHRERLIPMREKKRPKTATSKQNNCGKGIIQMKIT